MINHAIYNVFILLYYRKKMINGILVQEHLYLLVQFHHFIHIIQYYIILLFIKEINLLLKENQLNQLKEVMIKVILLEYQICLICTLLD